MTVHFHHFEQITPSIRTYYFTPSQPVHYIAGQFIELTIPHDNKDKRGDRRWFTLSSAPTDELLAITTSYRPEASSSYKQALANITPEQPLLMASPMGDFVLPKDPSIPLIFVAGGIGCTPFHSIITELISTSQSRDITLLYGAQSAEEAAFLNTFQKALGDKLIFVPGQPITAALIMEAIQILPEHYLYIAGPEPMVETVTKDLKQAGVNKRHIFGDFFPGYLATQ